MCKKLIECLVSIAICREFADYFQSPIFCLISPNYSAILHTNEISNYEILFQSMIIPTQQGTLAQTP